MFKYGDKVKVVNYGDGSSNYTDINGMYGTVIAVHVYDDSVEYDVDIPCTKNSFGTSWWILYPGELVLAEKD